MTVKDLKNLLDGVDESLHVLMCCNGETFHSVNDKDSGIITFGEPCDKDGNPISEEFPDAKDITVFGLIGTEYDLHETEAH